MENKKRCGWVSQEQIYIDYHDTEWGTPCYDDQKLFEMLLLEGFQAGLSWITVLRKREDYREGLHNFDPNILANLSSNDLEQLLQNPKLIRNRLKMHSIVTNAKAYMEVVKNHGNFHSFIWSFVNHKPIINQWPNYKNAPTHTPESDAMSKALKKLGFKFIGTTICYAYMQATGMVNDHSTDCWKFGR